MTPKMLNTGVVMEDAQAIEYRKQGNGIPPGAYFSKIAPLQLSCGPVQFHNGVWTLVDSIAN